MGLRMAHADNGRMPRTHRQLHLAVDNRRRPQRLQSDEQKNGNSIFVPAAGYRIDSQLNFAGEWGSCWSSSPGESDSDRAYSLYFSSGRHYVDWYIRYNGKSIRPVSE